MGGVTFVTVHIVGENDNFGRTPELFRFKAETVPENVVNRRAN
jgi:hypothetical protein